MNTSPVGSGRGVWLITLIVVASAGLGRAQTGWVAAAPLPRGAAFPTESAGQIGRSLYLIAGTDYRVDRIFAYDLDRGAWTAKPTALLTNRHHFATAVLEGKVYVAGGCLGDTDAVTHRRTSAFERWDPATGHWTPLRPMLTARQAFELVAHEGRLYAVGGGDGPETAVRTVEVYDPARDEWRVAATAPTALDFARGVVHDRKLYVIGSTPEGVRFLRYDLTTQEFTLLPLGRAGERQSPSLAVAGTEILFVGGSRQQPLAEVSAYDVVAGTWRDLPPLPAPRAGAATAVADGRVYCIGGWGPQFDWAHPNASVFALAVGPAAAPGAAVGRRPYARDEVTRVPVHFGAGLVRGCSPTFTADGATVFTHDYSETERRHTILVSSFRAGRWSASEVAPFSGVEDDLEPNVDPDGTRVVFCSSRKVGGRSVGLQLWVVERTPNGWGQPRLFDPPVVHLPDDCGSASQARDGSMIFGRIVAPAAPGQGRGWPWELYFAPRAASGYAEPIRINDAVNPGGRTWSHTLAPDATFLVLAGVIDADTARPDSLGDIDLYVSFRAGGGWTRAQNLGPAVNTQAAEVWPRLSPDGRYLFFNRQGPEGGRIFQIDTAPLLEAARAADRSDTSTRPGGGR